MAFSSALCTPLVPILRVLPQLSVLQIVEGTPQFFLWQLGWAEQTGKRPKQEELEGDGLKLEVGGKGGSSTANILFPFQSANLGPFEYRLRVLVSAVML